MANIIRKTANTVAVKTAQKNIIGDFFVKCSLGYFQKKYYSGFYKEHYDASKLIIMVYADKTNPRKNHVILYAPTQSGKTTDMTLLYNMINESFIKEILGIKRVIYLTGDNQFELSEQSMDRFRDQCNFYNSPIRLSGSNPCKTEDFVTLEKEWLKGGKIPFIMIKNSDCKKFQNVDGFSLNNTLIMIDESHYGTKDIDSQVNKLLQNFGKDFSGDPVKLAKHNTYILSVSATPYNEMYADKVNNKGNLLKGIVHYKPGKGYIGFSYLYKNGNVEGLKDNSDVTDETKFKKFLKAQREKMDAIFEETGQKHAIIMRMQGKKTLLTEHGEKGLEKIVSKYGFKLKVVDCNAPKKKIDYDIAYKEIKYSQFDGGKNVLIIVKQGFSYGISIPDDIKPLISTIYDYRPSFSNATTDSTEQGLLGRMTGYHPKGLSKHLKIYISNEHLEALWGYHVHIPPSESPMPSKKRGAAIKCTFEEWDDAVYKPTDKKTAEQVKKDHIVLWNNPDLKPLVFKGVDVDAFFKRHPEFDYEKLLSKDALGSSTFLTPIENAFNKELLHGRFDEKLRVDGRRQIGDNGQNNQRASALGYVSPIIGSYSRREWKNPENAGKEGWAFVIDIRNCNGKKGIEIRIPYGTIGFSKDVTELKSRPICDGYKKIEEFTEEPMMVSTK